MIVSLGARVAAGWVLAVACAAAAAQPAADCPPPPPGTASILADARRGDARDRGLLWRLDKDGRTSWLYGTMHVSRPEWAVPGPRIRDALLRSDVVAMELDPEDPELARQLLASVDAGRSGRVMAGLLPLRARLAARACLADQHLAPLPPLIQLMTLSLVEARRDGFHPELAVDAVLWGMAQGAGKRRMALETPAQQFAALTPESEADERELVADGLREMEAGEDRALMLRLAQAWADGDEAVLADYPQWCRCLETPAERRLFRRLNDGRNPAIADKLAALHAGGERFFAGVGALHMTGPQALPVLLRARGFQVTRVPFPSPASKP